MNLINILKVFFPKISSLYREKENSIYNSYNNILYIFKINVRKENKFLLNTIVGYEDYNEAYEI